MMGVFKNLKRNKNVNFIRPSKLVDMGTIKIESMTKEDWCDSPVFYFTKEDDASHKFKSVANFQMTEIYNLLLRECNETRKSFLIDDTGHFEFRKSKKGNNYLFFVVDD